MEDYQISTSVAATNPPENLDGKLEAFIGMTVYMALLSVVGFIGNVLVIISVAISPKLRRTSYAFIVNLSVADLMVNVLVNPILSVSFFNYGWPHDRFWCRVVCYLFLLGAGVSLLTVTAIAASRYCFVSRLQTTYRKYCGCKSVAVILTHNWCVTILFALIHLWSDFSGIQYSPNLRFCFLRESDAAEFWFVNVIMIYTLAISFVLVPLLYCRIFRTLYVSQRRVQASVRNAASIRHWRQILHPAETKLTKMMVVIFILLLLCWMPICLMHFFYIDPLYQRLAVILLLTNSSVNPFVYAWFNTHFKRAYKHILLCGKRQKATANAIVI